MSWRQYRIEFWLDWAVLLYAAFLIVVAVLALAKAGGAA